MVRLMTRESKPVADAARCRRPFFAELGRVSEGRSYQPSKISTERHPNRWGFNGFPDTMLRTATQSSASVFKLLQLVPCLHLEYRQIASRKFHKIDYAINSCSRKVKVSCFCKVGMSHSPGLIDVREIADGIDHDE